VAAREAPIKEGEQLVAVGRVERSAAARLLRVVGELAIFTAEPQRRSALLQMSTSIAPPTAPPPL
jgi:hypothetical protein